MSASAPNPTPPRPADGPALRAGHTVVRAGTRIDDSFAEAFPMKATRLVITAHNPTWAMHAAVAATGFATSVIACGCEAGIERVLSPEETPDGRAGVAILIMSMSGTELTRQIERRVGQCVLTCPTTAVYAGLPEGAGAPVPLGKNLRFFGDGWQISKLIGGRRYWRVPVMDGEFVAQDVTPVITTAVGGGNLLLMCRDTDSALATAEAAVAAMRGVPEVILPFPGGVVRSGSKVGSKYKALMASTNDAFCPTLKGLSPRSEIDDGVGCVMEIVIDGLSEAAVSRATTEGLRAALALGADGGLLRIAAGNYGGKLGPFHFHLQALLPEVADVRAAAASAAALAVSAVSAEGAR
ncbi:formylmethanofuran--tetrahydromethanopterin N-formyltransferase [Pseudaquabacterium rugosum]|uniref:Formylmethanofuran--tetrahydromethanopterin formyltransferase n=1 Tax=Pseudaquabacterium rugosum TaxID=2984194 RepID=A0ABU9B5P2_9BURK